MKTRPILPGNCRLKSLWKLPEVQEKYAEKRHYRMVRKKQLIHENFIWRVGPDALYQVTRAEYKTEPDSIKIKDLIRLFTEYYLPKRNTYHNCGDFFWAKQTEEATPEEFWRRLIEIEKECNFNTISTEELLISKNMTAITDKKLRDRMMKEKTLELKKTIELIKQNTNEKKTRKNNTVGIDFGKRKKHNKRGTDTKNGKIRNKTKNQNHGKQTMQVFWSTELDTITQMPGTRNKL